MIHYEEDLGQKFNKNKTAIFFITSTQESTRQEIKSVLGLQEITQYEKYLGLPTLVGRKKKKKSFNFIKEKIWRKLQGWESRILSQVGREVLIKAVIQAIPTFTMGFSKSLWDYAMTLKL